MITARGAVRNDGQAVPTQARGQEIACTAVRASTSAARDGPITAPLFAAAISFGSNTPHRPPHPRESKSIPTQVVHRERFRIRARLRDTQ